MALLTFPPTPYAGEIYPVNPPPGINVYIWDSADQTWQLIGKSTGVSAGTYGTPLAVPRITVDSVGRITFAENVDIQLGTTGQIGLVQLVDDTISNDDTRALTAAQGYKLQNEIGDSSLLNPPYPNLVTAVNAANGPTGVISGSYGSGTAVASFSVNAQGRITAASNVPLSLASNTSLGVVRIGSNLNITGLGVLSVPNATGSVAGVAQLVNNTTTNDSTKALTAAAGYDLQQQIDEINVRNNLTFAGTLNASTGRMISVSPEGFSAGFAVNATLPFPSVLNNEYFVTVAVAGTFAPPGGVPVTAGVGDWFVSDGTQWLYYAFSVPYATTTTAGIVELATNSEVQAGTDSLTVVTPASLQSKLSSSVTSPSTTTIADSASVKLAYDTAVAAQGAANSIQYRQFDDISGFFNGVTTTFQLRIGGIVTPPVPPTNIMVALGGVLQIPGALNAYTISGGIIQFNTAPVAGTTFYATTVGAP